MPHDSTPSDDDFDRWHQTRAHPRTGVPGPLWSAAVALVRKHGIYGTAQALGISYVALKRHVDQPADRPRARFIELPRPPLADGAVIEIEAKGGTTVCPVLRWRISPTSRDALAGASTA